MAIVGATELSFIPIQGTDPAKLASKGFSTIICYLSTPMNGTTNNKQSCLGCLTLIFLGFVMMSALGQCSSGSSNTSSSNEKPDCPPGAECLSIKETEQLFCREIVKNPSNGYYEDCKKRGY